VRIEVKVSWVVRPCNVVVGYQRFRGPDVVPQHNTT